MDTASDPFMRESDAFSWYMESDPALRATIVAVAWLDRTPPFDVLSERLERATRLVPRFRQRPVDVPGRLSPPRWEFDPAFDLSWHLRRVAAPAPGSADTVLAIARTTAMTGFDRARPLWEFTVVEQVEGEGAALVMKVHHSLTDGIGGMQLLLLLFDVRPETDPVGPMPRVPGGPGRGVAGLVGAGLAHDLRRVAALARHDATTVVPAAARAARHPVRATRDLVEMARSVGRMVAPVRTTLSPVLRARGMDRALGMITVPLEDLRRASSAAGGSLNDGFLAAVTGGLRMYHERHGAAVDDLRVTMPISLRTPEDPVAQNRITLARFTVPAGVPDPAARIRAMGQRGALARRERAVPHSNAIAGTLNLLPPQVVGSMLKHVDFVASNVPGLAFPVFLCGVPVRGYYAFGPTLGAALNVTLVSYSGTCCVGVTVDAAAAPDAGALVDCLRAGFAEVVASGAGPPRRRARPRAPERVALED